MTTSRERIFNYIKRNHTVTTREISSFFGVSRPNVRYHLDILLNQGLIEVSGKRTTNRKGRPDLLFSISKFNKGSNLDILSNTLLDELKRQFPQQKDEIFRSMAAKISISVLAPEENDLQSDELKQLSQRLLTTIQNLDELNYQSHWEAHAEGPRIILKNCPYSQVEPMHPDICLVDKYLIEFLLKSKVDQIGKLELDERSIPHCTFVVSS
jgi:predicted ArsR family transcriptional regulator